MSLRYYRHRLSDPVAFYSLNDDHISYFYRLDEFPELKRLVLRHELEHRRAFRAGGFYVFRFLWTELRDYVMLPLRRDFQEMRRTKHPLPWTDYAQHALYGLFLVPIQFLYLFAMAAGKVLALKVWREKEGGRKPGGVLHGNVR